MPYDYYQAYPTTVAPSYTINTSLVVIIALAVAATCLVYFLFMDKNNEKNLNTTTKKIYDFFHFRKLYIEDIIKVAYLFCAIFITILSFTLIDDSIIAFIFLLAFGNLFLRIGFEMIMMFINIHKNVDKIAKNTKK